MKYISSLVLSICLLAACNASKEDKTLALNDLEYFEQQNVNVLVFSNTFNGGFNDEKNSGIEMILAGDRCVQGGAIRLSKTPEQWCLVPKMTDRKVDLENNSIEVALRYEDYDFDSRVVVTGKGQQIEIAVFLDKPVPEALTDAGFNLEFRPSQYWLKTYQMDGQLDRFPRYAVSETTARPNSEKPRQYKGFRTYDDRGTDQFVDPLPLAKGHDLLMAPEDPQRTVRITSTDADLELYDGRMLAQNGWFVVHSALPAGKTGQVVTWTVTPTIIDGWVREPNIGFNQVGYLPSQPKVAVIELDKNDKVKATADLYQICNDGSTKKAFSGKINEWGRYFKYNYVKFDFSSVTEPGIYYIQYGDTKTNNFLIDNKVYDHITDATSDVWIPIHMNHMKCREGYRIWHGEPFREGYLQAPESDHFDLHHQGATTDTKYKPLQLIPGLNQGGYFDAGDFDIETGSNINVVQNLIQIWDLFQPQRDETFVDENQRYVELHRPDGKADVMQYIEHGVLNLVAQAEQIGHMASTLSNSVLWNYHHLGDAASLTDGLHYDPSLKPYEVSADGKRSGTPDDMWAFTSREPWLDMRAANMFTSAARVLKGHNDPLAKRCEAQATRLRKEAMELMAKMPQRPNRRGMVPMVTEGMNQDDMTFQMLDHNVLQGLGDAIAEIPNRDEAYKERLRPYVEKYKATLDSLDLENPYGLTIGRGNWAGGGAVTSFGITACFAHKYFPEIIGKEPAFRIADYVFGCHPYHNYSLVAAVGAARPKMVFYGNNRADFSFIPGNMAPGLLFRNPDHFENFDDWGFLWGQNEGTIAGNCNYLTFASAFKSMIEE